MKIKELAQKYNLGKDDFWELKRGTRSMWIITHDAIERIAIIENIQLTNFEILNTEIDASDDSSLSDEGLLISEPIGRVIYGDYDIVGDINISFSTDFYNDYIRLIVTLNVGDDATIKIFNIKSI